MKQNPGILQAALNFASRIMEAYNRRRRETPEERAHRKMTRMLSRFDRKTQKILLKARLRELKKRKHELP